MRLASPEKVRGFALIEALAALVISSVGLMALATLQLKLSQSVDASRQRAEAIRIADQKIEALRAYTAISSAAGVTAWNDLASGTDHTITNVDYTRSWTVSGTSNDPLRRVSVVMTWTDRAGNAQTISLNSVISRTDPADSGSLGFPLPANTSTLQPKNRNINIPVRALDLGNGKSSLQVRSDLALVFSNDTGRITQTCSSTVTTASQLSGCAVTDSYLVTGYVSLDGTSSFPAALNVNGSTLSGTTGTTCYIDNSVNQNSGAVISGFKTYLCVVTTATAGGTWSGTLRLTGMSTGTNYLVCRFQYPSSGPTTANQRNVQPYVNVAESLDQQNYLISTATICPIVDGLRTTLHQSCTTSNSSRSTDCPVS